MKLIQPIALRLKFIIIGKRLFLNKRKTCKKNGLFVLSSKQRTRNVAFSADGRRAADVLGTSGRTRCTSMLPLGTISALNVDGG